MKKELWLSIRGGMTHESWLVTHGLLLRVYSDKEDKWRKKYPNIAKKIDDSIASAALDKG